MPIIPFLYTTSLIWRRTVVRQYLHIFWMSSSDVAKSLFCILYLNLHWITLRHERKLKFSGLILYRLVITLVKTKYRYNEMLPLEFTRDYAIVLRKNVSQKSEENSMISILVCESMINRYLSLKLHENYKKFMGKLRIKPVFLYEHLVAS